MFNKASITSGLFCLLTSTVTCKSKHYATVCVHDDGCYIKDTGSKYGSSRFQKFDNNNEGKGYGIYFGSNDDYSVQIIDCNTNEVKALVDNNDSWKVYKHSLSKSKKQEGVGCTRLWLDTDKFMDYHDEL
ncbi:hypothetical protein K502DRAFT_343721 [Neoconidiobolus thromboides FSU 785]|nr:hypothetical protein K502DRAFT_343721 [Neoconidiobolus thromboides FSU 785]